MIAEILTAGFAVTASVYLYRRQQYLNRCEVNKERMAKLAGIDKVTLSSSNKDSNKQEPEDKLYWWQEYKHSSYLAKTSGTYPLQKEEMDRKMKGEQEKLLELDMQHYSSTEPELVLSPAAKKQYIYLKNNH